MKSPFERLRDAGLRYSDPDLVKIFEDLDSSAPDFTAKARARSPRLFHDDANALSVGDYKLAVEALSRSAVRYVPPGPTPGFDAMTASDEDYRAELRRMGGR